jgi:hypothetical protein
MNPNTKRNQAGQDQRDDVRRPDESGEPQVQGRSQGTALDDDGDDEQNREREGTSQGPGKSSQDSRNQDWESGRQQAL